MSTKFSGVWGTFEYLDDTTEAIEELRKKAFNRRYFHLVLGMKSIMRWVNRRVPFRLSLFFLGR